MQKKNDVLDMDILVRKKPFREEKQGGFINDVDSEDEGVKANRLYSEFLGGAGEDDCSEVDDTESGVAVRRQTLKIDLDACKTMLKRVKEVERANGGARDFFPKRFLEKDIFKSPSNNVLARPSFPLNDAANFQRAVDKETRAEHGGVDDRVLEQDLDCLPQLRGGHFTWPRARCVETDSGHQGGSQRQL